MKRFLGSIVLVLIGASLFWYHKAYNGDSINVGEVLSHTSQLIGKDITVSGIVGNSYGLLGLGGFEIKDDSGAALFVVSTSGVPRAGTHVSIRGVLRQAYAAGTTEKVILVEDLRDSKSKVAR